MTKEKFPLTNKRLREIFREYNQAFFKSAIAEPTDISFKDIPRKADCDARSGCLGRKHDNRTFIHVSADYRKHPCTACAALIHEMIHLHLGWQASVEADHGLLFGAEVVRLFKIGAYEGLL